MQILTKVLKKLEREKKPVFHVLSESHLAGQLD